MWPLTVLFVGDDQRGDLGAIQDRVWPLAREVLAERATGLDGGSSNGICNLRPSGCRSSAGAWGHAPGRICWAGNDAVTARSRMLWR